MLIQKRQVDPCRAQIYAPMVLEQMPRLLGSLDREPQSLSYGSFDRTHWGWKFCDFPIMMSQIAGYPLALLWRYPFPGNTYHQNPRVLSWIQGTLEYVCRKQHNNGSFDSVGPFTQDHGNSLFMTYLMTEVRRLLGDAMEDDLVHVLSRSVLEACEFALRSSEDYAFISNHQALYALAFYNAAELLGDPRFVRRADQNIDAIIERQSPEGWYEEYGGADPGYESLGIFYLATYWSRTQDTRLLDSLRRSIDFFSHFVHPDGSVGGVYGSRHTSLYMPGGFELLASQIPVASAIAQFERERFARGNVVTPASSDSQNLGVIAYTYLEACLAPQAERTRERLPCESLNGLKRFPHAGLTVAGSPAYYAVASTSKGGVCRIFDRQLERIGYEDDGYYMRTERATYTSNLAGLADEGKSSAANQIVSNAQFGEVRQELPTPAKWLVLRLLNLTLFRNLTLGSWLRRKILARLILGRHPGQSQLTRSITFGVREVSFRDVLTTNPKTHVRSIGLSRSFTSIHMGSAKYFHASELESTTLPDVSPMADELNRNHTAQMQFTLRFAEPALAKSAVTNVVVETDLIPREEVLT